LSRSEEKPSMTHLKDVCSRGEGVASDVVLALEVVCSPGEPGGGVALARHGFDRPGNNNRDNSKKDQNKSKNH